MDDWRINMKNIVVSDLKKNVIDCFDSAIVGEDGKNKIETLDFLILPFKYFNNEYVFQHEAIDFLKYCREEHPEVNIDFLQNNVEKTVEFRSFDIWLPIVQVVNPVLVPVLVNIVSNYIWEQIKGREHEEVKVDFKVIIKNGDKSKEIHYNGDAKTFKETFGKIDVNKIMED